MTGPRLLRPMRCPYAEIRSAEFDRAELAGGMDFAAAVAL